MVRLAFAVMVEADADIMLVDEVLAVGDAAFAQKCMDVFHEKRRAGRTLVLVTHDMATVEELCDRAMLLDDGELRTPAIPRRRRCAYFRVNFAGRGPRADPTRPGGVWDVNVNVVDAWLEDAAGERGRQRRAGRRRSASRSRCEARRELEAPGVRHPLRRRGRHHGLRLQPARSTLAAGEADRVPAGGRFSDRRDGREPARAGPLLRPLLRRAQPAAGRLRAAPAAAARLRRLRHRRGAGQRDRATPTCEARSSPRGAAAEAP